MNQNNQSQVPVPTGLVNALMGYLQPQAQAQAQPGSAAPIQPFPHFQQQPALWPGWQPQANVAMPGGGQYMPQWAPQPMVQQQQAAPAAPQPPGPSVNAIAAAVAAAVQPLLADKNASPVGSKPDDEKILIEALRKGKADGLTPRQALEKLHNVNDHTETGWKNYFLDHLERLYPKVYRTNVRTVPYVEVPRYPSTSRSQAGPSSTSSRKESSRSPSRHDPPEIPRVRAKSPEVPPSLPRRCTKNDTSQAHSHVSRGNRGHEVPSPLSAARSKRGGPVDDFHAGTHIPPLAVYSKPKAPLKDPVNNRFSDDDKVFFIHYLRWRLRREGPIPTKSVLYAELAKQTPHRDADAWKRHWDEHPELPDRILIEARNRASDRTDDQTGPAASSLSESAQDGDSSGEDEVDDDDEDEGEGDDEDEEQAEDPRPADHPPAGATQAKRLRKPIVRLRVTESDLRAMAKYKAEKHAVWDYFHSEYACWEEFAKNNPKRSRSAWFSASIKWAEVIKEYMRQYVEASKEEEKPRVSPTPLRPPTTGSSASHSQAAESRDGERRASTSQKRLAAAARDPSPIQKRVKREEPEYIDLTSD